MVVFTCNYCGESLHKPKVEKHYQFTCRAGKSMTCVDCLKDFKEDYVGHTKCVTEEERYAAKGTYKNGIVKKGESKQESWVEMIGNIVDQDKSLTSSQKNIFSTLSQYSNVPRKKQKFINFMLSSSGRRISQKDIEDVWNIIEKYKLKNNSGNKNDPASLKRSIDEELETREAKLPKISNSEQTLDSNNRETVDKFNFKTVILNVFSKKQQIPLKKLKKKVKKAYLKANHEIDCEERFLKKIQKTLKKIPNLKIEDENIILAQNPSSLV